MPASVAGMLSAGLGEMPKLAPALALPSGHGGQQPAEVNYGALQILTSPFRDPSLAKAEILKVDPVQTIACQDRPAFGPTHKAPDALPPSAMFSGSQPAGMPLQPQLQPGSSCEPAPDAASGASQGMRHSRPRALRLGGSDSSAAALQSREGSQAGVSGSDSGQSIGRKASASLPLHLRPELLQTISRGSCTSLPTIRGGPDPRNLLLHRSEAAPGAGPPLA